MKRLAIAFAAILLIGASTNPSASSGSEIGKPPQNLGADPNSKATHEQRGTPALPFVVQLPTSPKDDAEKSEQLAREKIHSIDDGLMVIFTGLLTVATIFLGYFTYLLWSTTAKAVKDSANVASAAQFTADIQADIAKDQTDILRIQKEIQRIDLYATHRPKLVIKDVFFQLNHGLTFEIANIGATKGTITDGWFALSAVDDQRWFKSPEHGSIYRGSLSGAYAGGELRATTLTDPDQAIATRLLMNLSRAQDTASNIFFYGAFHYVDEQGDAGSIERIAVFRRHWDKESESFRLTDNPFHEYSD